MAYNYKHARAINNIAKSLEIVHISDKIDADKLEKFNEIKEARQLEDKELRLVRSILIDIYDNIGYNAPITLYVDIVLSLCDIASDLGQEPDIMTSPLRLAEVLEALYDIGGKENLSGKDLVIYKLVKGIIEFDVIGRFYGLYLDVVDASKVLSDAKNKR